MANRNELAALIKHARAHGWTVEPGRKSSHLRWVPPTTIGGGFYVSSATPGDIKAVPNIASDLAKRGLPKFGGQHKKKSLRVPVPA
jgi:hypothetical protein